MRERALASTSVVDVNGFAVTVHDSSGAPDSGKAIVLIHGSGGKSATHYFSLFPMLAAKHRVIGLDLAASRNGDGKIPTFADLTAQVVGALSAVDLGVPAVLVGYSLGAPVAIAAAAAAPELVDSLVLLNGFLASDTALRLRMSLWRRLIEKGDLESLAELQLLSVYSRNFLNAKGERGVAALAADFAVGPGALAHAIAAASIDVAAEARTISAPALVIGAIHDQLLPVAHSRQLFGALSDARYAEIDSGHGSLTERSAEIFHLVEDFVNNGSATRTAITDPFRSVRQLDS